MKTMFSLIVVSLCLCSISLAENEDIRFVVTRKVDLGGTPKAAVDAVPTDETPSIHSISQTAEFEWDEEFLNAARPMASAAPSAPVVLHAYLPTWCKSCPYYKTLLGIKANGIGGDDELTIKAHYTEVKQPDTPKYPAFWDGKRFIYAEEFDSLDGLKSLLGVGDAVVGSLFAGEVDLRSFDLDYWLKFIGDSGEYKSANKPIPMVLGSVTLNFPANFAMSWRTENSTLKLKFITPPQIQWGWIKQNLNGVSYDSKTSQVTLDLPRMVDPVVNLLKNGTPVPSKFLMNSPPMARISTSEAAASEAVIRDSSWLDEFAASPHGSVYNYPGPRTKANIKSHLIRDGIHRQLGLTEDDLDGYSLTQLENIHSSHHNGAIATRSSKPAKAIVKGKSYRRWYGCINGVCGWHIIAV